MNKPEASPFRRNLRLVKLGTGVVGSRIGLALQTLFSSEETKQDRHLRFQRANARRLRNELADLRGPAMKLGQLLSTQTPLLDPDAIAELSTLQMKAPAMHPTLMRVQFKAEFGRNPEDMFARFNPEPFAAASLGQVHRATTKDGADVAVKIQYPAVREIVDADLTLLRRALLPVRLAKIVPVSVVEELHRGILAECDYRNEARNIERFDSGMKHLPYLSVPRVFPELSGERVITMSFLPGAHIDEFLRGKPSQALRDRIGHHLTELFCYQTYKMHLLHADPHPGNYLFDSSHVGLVDFGCVKEIGPDMLQCIRQFAGGAWRRDERIYRSMIRVMRGPGVSPGDPGPRQALERVMKLYEMFYREDGTPADFGDTRSFRELMKAYQILIGSKFLSATFIFYSRAEMGLYMNLHRLGARVPAYTVAMDAMKE